MSLYGGDWCVCSTTRIESIASYHLQTRGSEPLSGTFSILHFSTVSCHQLGEPFSWQGDSGGPVSCCSETHSSALPHLLLLRFRFEHLVSSLVVMAQAAPGRRCAPTRACRNIGESILLAVVSIPPCCTHVPLCPYLGRGCHLHECTLRDTNRTESVRKTLLAGVQPASVE